MGVNARRVVALATLLLVFSALAWMKSSRAQEEQVLLEAEPNEEVELAPESVEAQRDLLEKQLKERDKEVESLNRAVGLLEGHLDRATGERVMLLENLQAANAAQGFYRDALVGAGIDPPRIVKDESGQPQPHPETPGGSQFVGPLPENHQQASNAVQADTAGANSQQYEAPEGYSYDSTTLPGFEPPVRGRKRKTPPSPLKSRYNPNNYADSGNFTQNNQLQDPPPQDVVPSPAPIPMLGMFFGPQVVEGTEGRKIIVMGGANVINGGEGQRIIMPYGGILY